MMELLRLYQSGKVKQKHDIRRGFDNIPATLQDLYTSKNYGKLLLSLDGDATTNRARL